MLEELLLLKKINLSREKLKKYLNGGGLIMVRVINMNGNEYIECQECGAYEFYEVAV
jgi:predicted nucleic-acid-binding Zn-ribbon protein